MCCEEVAERFADLLADTLDADTAWDLRRHLASCAACRAQLAGIEPLWEALARMPAPPVPSTRMRERFSAMVAAERAATDRRTASRRLRGRMWTAPSWAGEPLVQTALAASLFLAGVFIGRAWPSTPMAAPPPQADIADVRSELREMRQLLTLSLLQQPSATERLRGVSGTAQIEQPGHEVVAALLDTLLHDPNVNVRLAAVDALRRFSDRAEVRRGARQAVADSGAPLLQVAVIDFMVETRDPEAPSLFRRLADDASLDDAVRGRARWGLGQLAS